MAIVIKKREQIHGPAVSLKLYNTSPNIFKVGMANQPESQAIAICSEAVRAFFPELPTMAHGKVFSFKLMVFEDTFTEI